MMPLIPQLTITSSTYTDLNSNYVFKKIGTFSPGSITVKKTQDLYYKTFYSCN